MADEARVSQQPVISVETDPSANASVSVQALNVVRSLVTNAVLSQQAVLVVRPYTPVVFTGHARAFVIGL